MIAIINYGLGNIRSVQKAFERINAKCEITNDIKRIETAEKLVLPGVGHFKRGMKNIKDLGLIKVLNKKVMEEGTPILGICLGMQLMTNYSEEGDTTGLGWVDANTYSFKNKVKDLRLKVPHMGWNNLTLEKDNRLFINVKEDNLFYFVHSYFVLCHDENDVISKSSFEINFHSGFNRYNIYGVQFHPEKSHKHGLQIMKNFTSL